ncbi:hypothetical protein KS4_00550 [Poriferisphaera corsica]|uniref:Glycosyltransferase n=1 Tax=Poriferisphaera corsica TaxID=2528020 RepID=A0A517YP85_9BACT|nr:TIGR03087 family PEP-CTERM/XrtA system glycosyltransferase [Poriferisphaera corsica]QDU32027.1 hypothetical protein KS4_00550 [Poriferisphaera corsica]
MADNAKQRKTQRNRTEPVARLGAYKERPNVLMLTHRVPYPPDRGDRIRSYHLLKELSRHFNVSLASFTEEDVTVEQKTKLDRLTRRFAIQRLNRNQKYFRAGMSLLKGKPITTSVFYDANLAKQLRQWHTEVRFDAVVTFCSGMVQHARDIVGGRLQAGCNIHGGGLHLLDLVDVDSVKWANLARQSSFLKRIIFQRESKLLREVELGLHDRIDVLSVVSKAELEVYEQIREHHCSVSPSVDSVVASHLHGFDQKGLRAFAVTNGVDLDYFKARFDKGAACYNIVFVGVLDYQPNIEAVQWFATQVMPRIRDRVPDAKFIVVGKRPAEAVRVLDGYMGTKVVGEVPDVRPHVYDAAVVVAPLKIAPGVQNKVLEAMAMQRVVVCSPEAAKGIDAMVGRDLLTADTVAQYADTITGLLRNPAAREAISQAARYRVEIGYDWHAVLNPLSQYLMRSVRPKAKKSQSKQAISKVTQATRLAA